MTASTTTSLTRNSSNDSGLTEMLLASARCPVSRLLEITSARVSTRGSLRLSKADPAFGRQACGMVRCHDATATASPSQRHSFCYRAPAFCVLTSAGCPVSRLLVITSAWVERIRPPQGGTIYLRSSLHPRRVSPNSRNSLAKRTLEALKQEGPPTGRPLHLGPVK